MTAFTTPRAALLLGFSPRDGDSVELRGRLGKDRGLVVFVDQLEELLTQSPPDQAAATARARVMS